MIGRSQLVGGSDLAHPDLANTPKQDVPPLPWVSYFTHAGLSLNDAVDVARELRKRIAVRLRRHAIEHAEQRVRYIGDPRFRETLNRQIIAEELTGLHFSMQELERLQQGLVGLDLVSKSQSPTRMTVTSPEGERETFVVLEDKDFDPTHARRGDKVGLVIKNETTGETTRL